MPDKILLNIGGTKFQATRATLENSEFFGAMLDRRSKTHFDSDGSIFIDRDGTHFRHILNYLRDKTVPDLSLSERKQLLVEARYYKITGLIAELQGLSRVQGMGVRSKKTTKRRRKNYK
jgi:hypothetical protein